MVSISTIDVLVLNGAFLSGYDLSWCRSRAPLAFLRQFFQCNGCLPKSQKRSDKNEISDFPLPLTGEIDYGGTAVDFRSDGTRQPNKHSPMCLGLSEAA